MEFNGGKKQQGSQRIHDVKKLSMEQYKARKLTVLRKSSSSNKFTSDKKIESNKHKTSDCLSEREIRRVLKDDDDVIPGFQDDSNSSDTNTESLNEKIFLAATKSPDSFGKKKNIVEEPEILTLSSDEDEIIENSSPYEVIVCKKEPKISENMTFPPYLDNEVGDVGSQYVSIGCRAIRVGSYKFIPTETVSFCKHALKFTAPVVGNSDKQIEVHVPLACVVKILCSLEPGFSSIFIYLTPPFACHLRKQLYMNKEQGPYYDPCSLDESKKRLIIFINKISETLIFYFRGMYKNRRSFLDSMLLEELTKDEMNSLLISSAPLEIHSLLKKPIVLETSCQTLLIYPAHPSKGRITINASDYECLADEQFLNDVIIDFYLKWLHLEKLPDIYRIRTHVFSTFFYKRLTAKPKKNRINDPHEMDETLLPAQKRHARVKSWTKGINIFEKDFILIPINERSHWILAVICFPGIQVDVPQKNAPEPKPPQRQSIRARRKVNDLHALELDYSDRDEAESDEELNGIDEFRNGKFCKQDSFHEESKCVKHPCILIFDSMKGSNRSRIVSTLREYLVVEYKERTGSKREFTKQNMEGFLPQVPQQMNYSDCGVYTLQFAESFFDDPIKNYKLPIPTLEKWFPQEMVLGKRESIAKLIQSLVRQTNNSNRHPIPEIKFPSKKISMPVESESNSQEDKGESDTAKRKTPDDELQGNDFNPINFPIAKCSAKKISLNLSSKTIANAKDMRAQLDRHCVQGFTKSLQMIRSNYSDMADELQNDSDSLNTVDDDIYGDLDDPTESKDSSKQTDSTKKIVQVAKKLKLSTPEPEGNSSETTSNKFSCNIAPR